MSLEMQCCECGHVYNAMECRLVIEDGEERTACPKCGSTDFIWHEDDPIDLSQLTFDEDTHTYTYKGKELPNVTTMLKPLSAGNFERVDPATLMQAAERGTRVHEACLAYDFDNDADIDPDIAGYVQAYANFCRDYRIHDWIYYEKPLTDGVYAGTLDRFGKINGKYTLLDIKSGLFHSIPHYVQLAAYSHLLLNATEYASEKQMILTIKNDGKYVVHEPNEKEREYALNLFFQCKSLYKYIGLMKGAKKYGRK